LVLSFPLYVSLIPLVITVVWLGAGAALTWSRSLRPLGIAVLVGGVAFGAVFGPLLLHDRIMLDERGVMQRTGFWFSPTRKGFAFGELQRIRIERTRLKNGREQEVWQLELLDGTARTLDPGDLWDRHREAIILAVEARGVEVRR
jgi:hypothetical protein